MTGGEGMLTPERQRELMEAAKANRDKLDNCPRHYFPELGQIQFGMKATCRKCGGAMDLVAVNYYVRGYEAAGKNGNDIVPGWKPPDEPTRKYFKGPGE
ncbi:hypothetical protein [Sphingomonas phage Kimi]|nr:hypothetical protein [Sphingomonas phage Kimi]